MTKHLEATLEDTLESIHSIPISALRPSPLNVRKTRPKSDEDVPSLVSSICSLGLLHNLAGTFESEEGGSRVVHVHCGSRRMEALLYILKHDLPITIDGHQVPAREYQAKVRIFPDTQHAVEASLMENIGREQMTPADNFRAWSEIKRREKLTDKEIARRTGQTLLYVQKCLALGNLEPGLLSLFESGGMDLDAAKALTLAPTHADQLAAVARIRANPNRYDGAGIQAWEIKRELTENKISTDTPLGHFVKDAYLATEHNGAKLPVTQDLFSGSPGGTILLDDVASARMIATFMLMAECDRLTAAGWSWATPHLSYDPGRSWSYKHHQPDLPPTLSEADETEKMLLIQANEEILSKYPCPDPEDESYGDYPSDEGDDEPEYEQQDAFEDNIREIGEPWTEEDTLAYEANENAINAIDARAKGDWSPELRATLGCFVTISREGTLLIERGYEAKEEPAEGSAVTVLNHPQTVIPPYASTPNPNKDETGLSDAVVQDLGVQRTLALQAALMDSPDHAFTLNLYTLWGRVELSYGDRFTTPSSITASLNFPDLNSSTGLKTGEMEAALALKDRQRDFSDLRGKTGVVLFDAIHAMPEKERKSLLAYLVARTVDAPMHSKKPVAEHVGVMMSVNPATVWRPGLDFLPRVSKAWLEKHMPDAIGGGLTKLAKSKKGERVEVLAGWFKNPYDIMMKDIGLNQDKPIPQVRADQVANWLPPGMAFEELPAQKLDVNEEMDEMEESE